MQEPGASPSFRPLFLPPPLPHPLGAHRGRAGAPAGVQASPCADVWVPLDKTPSLGGGGRAPLPMGTARGQQPAPSLADHRAHPDRTGDPACVTTGPACPECPLPWASRRGAPGLRAAGATGFHCEAGSEVWQLPPRATWETAGGFGTPGGSPDRSREGFLLPLSAFPGVPEVGDSHCLAPCPRAQEGHPAGGAFGPGSGGAKRPPRPVPGPWPGPQALGAALQPPLWAHTASSGSPAPAASLGPGRGPKMGRPSDCASACWAR